MSRDRGALIEEAERQIAAILERLEGETQMLVREISVSSTEVTRVDDSHPQYRQRVEVKMYRLPGHQW